MTFAVETLDAIQSMDANSIGLATSGCFIALIKAESSAKK
jgi:hypothetical protein